MILNAWGKPCTCPPLGEREMANMIEFVTMIPRLGQPGPICLPLGGTEADVRTLEASTARLGLPIEVRLPPHEFYTCVPHG